MEAQVLMVAGHLWSSMYVSFLFIPSRWKTHLVLLGSSDGFFSEDFQIPLRLFFASFAIFTATQYLHTRKSPEHTLSPSKHEMKI